MPSDVPSQAQLARLSILNLHSLAAERKIPIPKQALDLEVRAIVARHLHGGNSAAVCFHCGRPWAVDGKSDHESKPEASSQPATATGSKPAHVQDPGAENPFEELPLPENNLDEQSRASQDPGAENPFEDLPPPESHPDEKSRTAAVEAASSEVDQTERNAGIQDNSSATSEAKQDEPDTKAEPSKDVSEEQQNTPERPAIAVTEFTWTPAEKPVRIGASKTGGNQTGKVFETTTVCKVCDLVKCPTFEGAKAHHGATCGYCRARLVFHGRKHLRLKGAGKHSDFTKEQLQAIKAESLSDRSMAEKESEKPKSKRARKKRRTR